MDIYEPDAAGLARDKTDALVARVQQEVDAGFLPSCQIALIKDGVIGVAKTRFASATDAVAMCRGSSRSPVFISAVGMSADEAAANVAIMQGPYRIPTLLKQVDALARTRCFDT